MSSSLLRRISFYSKRYRKLIWSIVLVFSCVNIILYFLQLNARPKFEIDEIYKGTFRGKYLESITDINQLNTEEFYTKWSAISYLDDMVNEPIQEPKSKNSLDPYEVIQLYETSSGNESPIDYTRLSLSEKISFYTSKILPESGFKFTPIQDIIYKDAYFSKKFISTRLKKWLKIKAYLNEDELKFLEIDDDWFEKMIIELRNKKLNHNLISATEIKHVLTHLKFFSSLYLHPSNENTILNSDQTPDYLDQCKLIQSKLFNWLSNEYPIFKKYDNQMKASTIQPFEPFQYLQDSCFLKSIQSSLNGKGLVITTNNNLVPELAGLLSLLRILGNTLPIQIFHDSDLSLESIKILSNIAKDPIMKLPKLTSSFKAPSKPIALDLTFVDVSDTIPHKFKKYYGHFGMKLLAYLFNSFEEMIMLDTDTVVLDRVEQFFNSDEYIENGAYFFRDRDANSFLYEGIVEYYKSYLNYDQESHYLELPKVSNEVLNNRFFGNMARHFMESGLFAINKKQKFDGVIAAVMLQMFTLFSGSLHGEKEFIWLGQEIMGQSYGFNLNPAIAVGELSPSKGLISSELCSTHPAHMNSKDELLWFNSGFLTCKKPQSYYKDINYERNSGKSLVELKKEYLSPLHITHGLMPPPAEFSVITEDGEPDRGWMMTQQCSNYLWCSYDLVGGGINTEIPKGRVIEFDLTDTSRWDYLGRLWVNYFNIGYTGGSDSGFVEGDNYDELGLDDLDVFQNEEEDNNSGYDMYDDEYTEGKYNEIPNEKSSGNTRSKSSNLDATAGNDKAVKKSKLKQLDIDVEDDDDGNDATFHIVNEEKGISKDIKEDYGNRY